MLRLPPRIIALSCMLVLVGAPVGSIPGHAQGGPAIIAAEATRISFPLTVEALGTAIANESIEIRPNISETVTAIKFKEGQTVSAGQVLVELRNAEALASVAVAKAALVDSESKFHRGEQLLASQLMAESELEALLARRDADRAQLDAAEARLAETVLRAPFSGRVGLRRVSLGSLVGPSVVITTLDDTDPIKVDFDVPETSLAMLATGLPVEASSAAWPDSVFHGTIASINTRVDPVSRTIAVRALVPNPQDRLLPGMFLTVRVLRREVTALMIPEQALIPEQSRQFVLVVGADSIVEKREVQVGRRRPGAVEITQGLTAGELVVVEGTQKARPGSPVTVQSRVAVQP